MDTCSGRAYAHAYYFVYNIKNCVKRAEFYASRTSGLKPSCCVCFTCTHVQITKSTERRMAGSVIPQGRRRRGYWSLLAEQSCLSNPCRYKLLNGCTFTTETEMKKPGQKIYQLMHAAPSLYEVVKLQFDWLQGWSMSKYM